MRQRAKHLLNPSVPKHAPLAAPDIAYALFEHLGEGVTVTDAGGHIVYTNGAADRILGIDKTGASPDEWAEHYGAFLPDRTTPFPTDEYPLVRALQGEETNSVEMFIRNAGVPQGVLIACTGRPLRDDDGAISGATVVFRDITALRSAEDELKRTNAELRDAQRRQAELSTFIVHDLKSPLTGIIGNVSAMLDATDMVADDRECLVDIRAAAWSMHRMVLDMLDLHLAEDGELNVESEAIDVSELLADIARAMAPRAANRRQSVSVAPAPSATKIRGDRRMLSRVLQNLVDNCVKYGPGGGTICLDASRGPSGTVVLRVRDNGPGVPAHLRERIFEKYARVERNEGARHHDSRGLGLRFCRVAAEAHGGRIWVEDNAPKGACFCVELSVI